MSGQRRKVGYLGRQSAEVDTIFKRLLGDGWDFVSSGGAADTPAFHKALPSMDYMIVSATQVTRALVAEAPELKFVHKFGVGYDDIDVDALAERGIVFAVCPAGLAEAVAEHTLALTLAALKRITQSDDMVRRQGGWPTWQVRNDIRRLAGQTVGIVGFGRIGQVVARLFLALGCNVLAHDRSDGKSVAGFKSEAAMGRFAAVTDLDAVFARSSIVSLHVPLTPQTRNLVTEERMVLLGRDGLLVNTARGGVVDQDALIRVLASGQLGFAALDVVADERPGTSSPLYALQNIIVTPHVAGGGLDVLEQRAAFVVENLRDFDAGRPVREVVGAVPAQDQKGVPA